MHSRTRLSLAAAASLLALGACALSPAPSVPVPDRREQDVIAHPDAEEIPLYTTRRVPGCRHRSAGELTSPTLMGLRDAALERFADAVVQVRKHVRANTGERTQFERRPIATIYYTGLAVRFFEEGCQGAGAQPGSGVASR